MLPLPRVFHADRSMHSTSLRHLFCASHYCWWWQWWSICVHMCLWRSRNERTLTDHGESNCLIFQRRKWVPERRDLSKVAKQVQVNMVESTWLRMTEEMHRSILIWLLKTNALSNVYHFCSQNTLIMDKNASREFCFQYDLPMGNNYKSWIKNKKLTIWSEQWLIDLRERFKTGRRD